MKWWSPPYHVLHTELLIWLCVFYLRVLSLGHCPFIYNFVVTRWSADGPSSSHLYGGLHTCRCEVNCSEFTCTTQTPRLCGECLVFGTGCLSTWESFFPHEFIVWSTVWCSLLILNMSWFPAVSVINSWPCRLWSCNSSPHPPSPNPHYEMFIIMNR
jgi:hypothetical protein